MFTLPTYPNSESTCYANPTSDFIWPRQRFRLIYPAVALYPDRRYILAGYIPAFGVRVGYIGFCGVGRYEDTFPLDTCLLP